MISFPDAVRKAFANYSNFSGRATRPEYWWFYLFGVIVTMIPYVLLIAGASGGDAGAVFYLGLLLLTVAIIAIILPGIAVLVRRLHDTDKSGWWYWIVLVPFIGGIWLLILLILPGTPGQNRFG